MELTAQLKNPKGRVVTRLAFERYPEKSYYILSHVEHGYHKGVSRITVIFVIFEILNVVNWLTLGTYSHIFACRI